MAFVNEATIQLQFTFVGKGRKRATLTFYFPIATPHADVLTTAAQMLDQWAALSNALVPKYTIRWYWYDSALGEAAEEADTQAALVLFYRNEDGKIEKLHIPSPKSSDFETTGDLSGIRADAGATDLLPFTANAATTLAGVVSPSGQPLAGTYEAGGLAL